MRFISFRLILGLFLLLLGEALPGESAGRPLSLRNHPLGVPTSYTDREGNTVWRR